jgi:WD40 repeat protein
MSSTIGRVDRLADRFEAAWRAGQAVRIEDYLAEVGEDDRSVVLRELLVVEMQLRNERGEFEHEADTRSVAFTHDGKLATTTNDGAVSLWNLATGRVEWRLPGAQKMKEVDLVFHPDGSRFAICRGGQDLTLWDYRYRQRLLTLREHADLSGHAVRFSSDGTYLAAARIDGSICIWQSPDGHD